MWGQWSQYGAAPPLPTTAPPPPPQEPGVVTTPTAPPIIGPMLPAAATPVAPLPVASALAAAATPGAAAMPAAVGANPYSQYTAAQYAAMTPEQQFALQQHWQQWQSYQEEYARWHAQYGEQYKREMELAQKATNATPGVPTAAAATPTAYSTPYFQQPPPTAPSNKITGQPQLYTQPPPPQAPAPATNTPNPTNYSSLGAASASHQQPPWQAQQPPPSYNQPPPNFNQQKGNVNNSYMNTQQFQQPSWGGQQQQGGLGGARLPRQGISDISQYSNRNDSGGTAAGPGNWQGPPSNRAPDNFNNNSMNRSDEPNTRVNNNWYKNQNSSNDNGQGSASWNNRESSDNPTSGRGESESSTPCDVDKAVPADKNIPMENENIAKDNNDFNNRGLSNRNIGGPSNWNDKSNNQGGVETHDRNQGQKNWNENITERNIGQHNWGSNNMRGQTNWNDGSNRGTNNGPNDWNENNSNNRGPSDQSFGSNNRGPSNWNQGSNNRGPNNWNGGPNQRGANMWNEGPNSRDSGNWKDGSNRAPNNWNEGPLNRGSNNWNDGPYNRGNNGPNDRNFGSNNRGPNSWNDSPSNRGNNPSNDLNAGSNSRGSNERNFFQNNRGNIYSNDRNDSSVSGGDRRSSDNSDNNTTINRGPNAGGPPSSASGVGNRNRITDLDEEMFDRQFRQWEQQFEDWKKANANHPDKEMYKRYEEEFEKQRKRIAERREQMRRRKLEQMGLDPNQPPPQAVPSRSLTESVEMENVDNPDSIGKKRSNSIGSQQSFNSKQNQDHNQEPDQEIKTRTEEESQPEISHKIVESDEPTMINENSDEVVEKSQDDEIVQSDTIKESPQQTKNTVTPLGKRKSRFDTPTSAIKIKPITNNEIITLDEDDAELEKVDENQGNISEIFKKVDGIPGLDLTDETSSDPAVTQTEDKDLSGPANKPDQKIFKEKQTLPVATPKKIPSLFDIKVDKPDMTDLNDVKEQSAEPSPSTALPDLAKTLNDPDFLKRISEAVATAKGTDVSKSEEIDNRQLSFTEWQHRKQGDEADKKDEVDINCTNSRESFRDRGSNRSDTGDDLNINFKTNSGGGNWGGRGIPNNMGPNNNFGPNNNLGPNGPNNWGTNSSNVGPNGPNIWGPNDSNNWGPSGPNGHNNWGQNGPNNNNNNNFGPNGPNNWGPNGPNNWGPNGPNNWGPNGSNNWGPNNNNNNWGSNAPNIWGPNGPNNFGPNGSNNFGPNGPNNFGSNNNFRGGNNGPGRNFGGNGSDFGPNDASGRNFGRNDGPARNFGRDRSNFGPNDEPGRNFGRNSHNFGPNEGFGRNFGGDGSGRNFDRDDSNFGPNDRNAGKFNRNGRESRDGNRRNRGRSGSNDRRVGSKNRNDSSNRRDNSNNRNNQSKDGSISDDAGKNNRNVNNPFRRNDAPKVTSLEAGDSSKSKDQVNSWVKGPDDRDNLDYGDYYRPVQVIDYSNSNATPTTTITPRVIDYGHRPVVNDDNNAFKPLKIINYDHASKANNPKQQAGLTATQKRRKRKNKNNAKQQRQQNQNQNQQQQQKQTNLSKNATTDSIEEKDVQEQNIVSGADKEQDELEEISDVEDLPDEPDSPPPPPPPMFNTAGTFTPFSCQDAPSSIFPSTSDANENLPKVSAAHVQMSIPTEENNNTISIDEIIMKPGRQTRPRKICIILRGPPGSGKSHVAKLIKEKEKEMGGNNPRLLSIDDYFLIENDYEEKCPKTGKKLQKKEILYEYDKEMEEKYLEYLIKAFKKSVADNFYDFIVVDCNNNSLRSLNEFYCHSKDSGFVPYIIDLFCDLETCLERNIHERSEKDIKEIIDTWKPTPGHYIKLDISSLLQNIVEMEDAEDMAVDDNAVNENDADSNVIIINDENDEDEKASEGDYNNAENVDDYDEDDSNDSIKNCGFLKSKWETDTTIENLARLDGTSKLSTKRKPTMEEYLQMDEWEPPKNTKGQKRVRWADIEEKRKQEKMRAVGFVVGQTDWKRMMDPNAAKRALNKTKYIERINKRR